MHQLPQESAEIVAVSMAARSIMDLESRLRLRSDCAVGGGVHTSDVDAAEAQLNVTFPHDLRVYLQMLGSLEIGHREFFGLGTDLPRFRDIVAVTLSERTMARSPLRHDLIPLLNDGGGNLICIVVAGTNSGRIVFWDHDDGGDQAPSDWSESLAVWLDEVLSDVEQ